ncbi:hypothetical protein SLEP1_g42756 [Rubroshorea leprosula]|uniref:Reverse transcriptase domain-containing protein n=1 Tax=Rubroshorea leprosula TaxID=152421 RepID=A0AAV5LBA7_9ROSI|nr:hypothetical protein SLEP1_g42756 [Rubroshorea leprosula]
MWPILKKEICEFVVEFHSNGKWVRGSNAAFIVLIPKKDNPTSLADYQPISLIGCMYKVISKLLAYRMNKVMDSIISPTQSTFIKGRQIADGIVITNELILDARKRRKSIAIFKVDFEKAYDNVNWNFLNSMLRKMGFCPKWCSWIKGCLSSTSILVLVNGSPIEEFQMSKGLSQGDPLAPFLFLVVAEALNGLIGKAIKEGLFKGVTIGLRGMEITHLQFADDTILFCEASRENIWGIKRKHMGHQEKTYGPSSVSSGVLSLFRNPEILPPIGKSGFAATTSSSPLAAPALWGFRELPLALPPASSPCSSGSLHANSVVVGLNPFYTKVSMIDLK